MTQEGKLKIINKSDGVDEVIKQIRLIEGVVDVVVDGEFLTYELDEWASDYDVMVAIMNLLKDNSIESEPYFDDDKNVKLQVSEENNTDITDDCHDDDCGDDDDCDDGCCHHHHYHDGGKGFFKENKGKIIELSIAIVILVIGCVLSAIPSVAVAAPYVQIVAFTLAGYEILFEAIAKIFKKQFFTEEILMTIASIAAILLGEVTEAAGIMILFSIGELFEDGAIDNSRKVINNLKKMRPEQVTLITDGGDEKHVKPETVEVGSVILVKAGEKIAIDGIVISGKANVDTKTITGESAYREVEEGSEVLGGFINADGVIKIKTIKLYKDSAVSRIMEIVENASAKKSKSEKFITVFSKYYTPIVMISAILLAFIPPIFYETYLQGLQIWLYRSIMMLCVACPCALVISVPLTYFCGAGAAAANGVIVKSSEHLEKLAKCNVVAFDKTGTLTTGEFDVTKILSSKNYQGKVLYYAAVCEKNSNHPIAKSIIKKYGKNIDGEAESCQEISGRGLLVKFNDEEILCGNAKLLREQNVAFTESEETGVKIYVAVNGEFAGVIILNDTVKATARGAIMELYDEGVTNTVMLTGDNKEYASKIRKELDMRQSVSELLPEGKVAEIERIMGENKKQTVVFVGDGINDAPVLARADVGVAMGGLGSEVAVDSADIVITDDDLSKIPYAIKLAKRTNSIAKQNIIISLVIKFGVMILALSGITNSLWLAIASDVGVMILAILNAIRNRSKIY